MSAPHQSEIDKPSLANASNPWKEAVIEACIVNCISWDENDPIKTLRNLISWEVQVALDPAVSEAAQALIDKGRNEILKGWH